jgi:hypothetical protein
MLYERLWSDIIHAANDEYRKYFRADLYLIAYIASMDSSRQQFYLETIVRCCKGFAGETEMEKGLVSSDPCRRQEMNFEPAIEAHAFTNRRPGGDGLFGIL